MSKSIYVGGKQMTNYEKYKEEIINMLARGSSCIKLIELCGHNGECGAKMEGVR